MADYDKLCADLDKLTGTATSVAAKSSSGGGTLWSTYQDALKKDRDDIHEKGAVRCWPDKDKSKAYDYLDGEERASATSYSQFLAAWNGSSGYRADMALLNELQTNSTMWMDDVYDPTRHDSATVRKGKLLQSWYGPGAEAYASVQQAQTAAMDEMSQLVQAANQHIEQIISVISGIGSALKTYGDSLNNSVSQMQDNDDYVACRANQGANNFAALASWLSSDVGEGDWKKNFDDMRRTMEDSLFNSKSFGDDKWPEIKADMSDMKNGNGGLDKNQQPTAPPTAPTPPANPGTPITAPTAPPTSSGNLGKKKDDVID